MDKLSQTEYEALIECLSDGIIMRDRALTITKINPALTNLLGYNEADLLGKKVHAVIPTKHLGGRPLLDQELTPANSLKFNASNGGTYVWTKKDGGKLTVDAVTSAYRVNGRLEGSIMVIRDISERAAIDRAKTEFVSLAAHQLRTPLSSINWYLEMLADDAATALNNNQKAYLSEVRLANQRLVNLVNDLLNVSRIDVGSFPIKPQPTDLEAVINIALFTYH
jgi:PAS domain S-box-containing protein